MCAPFQRSELENAFTREAAHLLPKPLHARIVKQLKLAHAESGDIAGPFAVEQVESSRALARLAQLGWFC